MPCAVGCCDASQAIATRRALNGWLYLAPLDPETPGVRQFKNDVRKLTRSEFGVTLAEDEPIDAAAAKLYDGIYLWAKALSRVFSNNGAPPAWSDKLHADEAHETHRELGVASCFQSLCVGRVPHGH